jgi:hypothetical protein
MRQRRPVAQVVRSYGGEMLARCAKKELGAQDLRNAVGTRRDTRVITPGGEGVR